MSETVRQKLLGQFYIARGPCCAGCAGGHMLTKRDHYCGAFKDNFDWGSLPPQYLRQIGYRPRPTGGQG